jgi:hypothetical protein
MQATMHVFINKYEGSEVMYHHNNTDKENDQITWTYIKYIIYYVVFIIVASLFTGD